MLNEQASEYRRRQRVWAGRTQLSLGGFVLLGLILNSNAFHHLWGVVIVVPLLAAFYCCARSLGALRKFRRAMREEKHREDRVL